MNVITCCITDVFNLILELCECTCLCLFLCVCLSVRLLKPSIHLSVFLSFILFKQVNCRRQEKSKTSRAPRGSTICRHGNETTGGERGPVELSRFESHVSPRSLFILFLTRAAHFARCKSSHILPAVPHSSSSPSSSFAVKPTVIDVGIYVNSIGPVSSIDMVSPNTPFHYLSLRSCSRCPRVKAGGNAGGQTRGSTRIKQMS